ncbi:MAG: chemotaxis protein CheA [Gemmatimonadaceae bacterium]
MDPQRYAELFRSESREQLSEINRALLDLEQAPGDVQPVTVLFRAVHTLKGMSATMGYTAVAAFAHELESLLDRVRNGDQGISAELMDVLFSAADVLETGVDRAVDGTPDAPGSAEVLEQMHHVAGGRATAEFRTMTGEYRAASTEVTGEFAVSSVAVAASAASLDEGPGVLVRVRQSPDTLLPGVRAFLVIQKVRELGEIVAVSPPLAELQAAEVPQAFAFRLVTTRSAAEIEAAIVAAGDVEHVEVSTGRGRQRAPVRMGAGDEAAAPKGTRHVRIELARLDTLMNLIGELVIARGRLLQLTAGHGDAALDEVMTQTGRLVGDLQGEIMASRMVPVWQVFDRFPRLVRDAARQLHKEIEFRVEGKEIELDRSLLDEIGEPVVHLLRNAVDHGIEAPEVRETTGKPRTGHLVLSASRERSAVLVRVRDDGRGIDRARVLARAKELGMVGADVARLDDDMLFRVIAAPGFSTAAVVSDLSGRGVGIDAVQARVRQLGGTVEMETEPGRGTTMTLRLPQTLAIVRAVLATVGGERYALPLTHVRETLAWSPEAVQRVQGKEVLVLRDEVLPLLHLREVLKAPGVHADTAEIVVLERGARRAGLVVDELTGQQDIVVKQFDGARDGLALFSGATILSDGRPALIVDVGSLL